MDFLPSCISNALKHCVHNCIQLSLLYGMIHLCLSLIKLESHSGVKSWTRAALCVVLPSVRVRLHSRLSTKLGNCPVTADKRLLVQIIPSQSWRELLWNHKHLDQLSIQDLGIELKMSNLKGKREEYLSVKDLQKVLDSCKLHLSQVDEVWPNIYIGNL